MTARHATMGEYKTVRSPVSYNGERSLAIVPPPVLGEHNEEILGPLRA